MMILNANLASRITFLTAGIVAAAVFGCRTDVVRNPGTIVQMSESVMTEDMPDKTKYSFGVRGLQVADTSIRNHPMWCVSSIDECSIEWILIPRDRTILDPMKQLQYLSSNRHRLSEVSVIYRFESSCKRRPQNSLNDEEEGDYSYAYPFECKASIWTGRNWQRLDSLLVDGLEQVEMFRWQVVKDSLLSKR